MNTKNSRRRGARNGDGDSERIERLLEELEPVELPPFFRSRLLARIQRVEKRPSWIAAVTGRNVGWGVAAACVVALLLVVVHFNRTPAPTGTDPLFAGAGATAISPIMPVDSSFVSAGDVQILASIDPPIKGGLIRLFVDDRDVTGLAEVAGSYVMYSPAEKLAEGEHIVSIQVRDASGVILRDVSWLFNTVNGNSKRPDERV
ncbi:hypothetical protein KAW64_11215 [bacterium]|nr:hypothetical protein [bacterium]